MVLVFFGTIPALLSRPSEPRSFEASYPIRRSGKGRAKPIDLATFLPGGLLSCLASILRRLPSTAAAYGQPLSAGDRGGRLRFGSEIRLRPECFRGQVRGWLLALARHFVLFVRDLQEQKN